jgi:hypothetical protein
MVLLAAISNDADYMGGFQREEGVLASFNHLNITAICGLEDRALMMEWLKD